MLDPEVLRRQYADRGQLLTDFARLVNEQVTRLMADAAIPVAGPVESRVKSWESISQKISQRGIHVDDIFTVEDLVGVRVVVLFLPDLERAREVLESSLRVLDSEDTATRLDTTQFGYKSWHFRVMLPDAWLETPTNQGFRGLTAELQLRTLAQHLWAAASHVLQYKAEESVPAPLRRTIHRVSALLETADLEFQRVLDERAVYVRSQLGPSVDAPLDVDLIRLLLDDGWPPDNYRDGGEDYWALQQDLASCGITTVGQLRDLITLNREAVLQEDADTAALIKTNETSTDGAVLERVERGIWFTHVGLTREALGQVFGPDWRQACTTVEQRNRADGASAV